MFSLIHLLETGPPTRWRCALTPPSRAISHTSRRSSLTPETYTRSRQEHISQLNIGLPPGPYYQRLQNIEERPVSPKAILIRSPHKRRRHAYTPSTQSQTQSLSNSTRQILSIFRHWPYRCQHHCHQQHPQTIVLRQTKQ